MTKSNQYFKNTIILFIGKFSTQFMSIILLPLFTRYLLTEDYGYVDLIQTYINLFLPIIILRLDSATFRFLIDERKNNEERDKTIANDLSFAMLVIFILSVIFVIFNIFFEAKYITYIFLNFIILIISTNFMQILRGLGKVKEYSIASILTGISNLIVNIFLLTFLKFDASCIFISSMISNIICIIYIFITIKKFNCLQLKKRDKNKFKKMLNYSIPTIPNSLSWWIVNVSDRTIISFFLGVVYNGIYTVSCKFSNILNSVFSIFNMSWTEQASIHINDEDKEQYFNEMINKIFNIFSAFGLIIISMIPLFYALLIGNNYYDSYNYIPILIFANTWNVLSWLCGGIYVAKKETKKAANTTIFAALINIIINFLLIKKVELYAACISTLISYILISFYRYFDCRKIVKFKISLKKIIAINSMYILIIILYYYNIFSLNIFSLIISIMFSIILNRRLLIELKDLNKIIKVKWRKNEKKN